MEEASKKEEGRQKVGQPVKRHVISEPAAVLSANCAHPPERTGDEG